MNIGLLEQFMLWNGSINTACCLIQHHENNSFSVVAFNSALSETLNNAVDFASLENFSGIAHYLQSIFENKKTEEWTDYNDNLNRFFNFTCQLMEHDVCALWITEAEQKSTEVLGDIPIGIIRMRAIAGQSALHCSYMNREARKMTQTPGQSAGSAVKVSQIMQVDAADAASVEESLAAFIAGGDKRTFECRLALPQGQNRWIRAHLAWIVPQKLLQIAFADVSSEKQTEAHSRQNQALLQKILDTTQAAIFWKDAQRRFIGVNKAFLEYYGFDSVQVLQGKNDEDMGWHSSPDPYKNDELRVLQGETTTRVPGMCFCKGENRHIVASKSPLMENGKIVGLVGSFEDVTSEVRLRNDVVDLNCKLQAALEKERQANQAKSDFLLRMSHDMRTPLTTIIGYSDLELKKRLKPELVKVFSTIKTCSNFLLGILSDILDLQKLSNGKLELKPSICEASATAKNIESIIRPQAEARNITFVTHFNCAAANCHSQIDTRKVQQIIVNLLNNAVKYTQPGGTIIWHNDVSGEDAQNITVTHVISDNGPGMSKEFQATMYAPFTQENATSSNGSGLGLAITKKLVDILGGSITCNSAPGKGTTFTLVLPHKKASQVDIAAYYSKNAHPTDSTELRGKKVLICEDNIINSEILKELLESEGMACDMAFNGQEAVDKARTQHYHIILMDIRMPVMDGYQATREIREFDLETPVVALSANVFSDEVQNAFEAGMDDFLEKPIVIPRLLATLRQFLSTSA